MKLRPRDVSILVALAVLTCAGFCEASTLTVSAPKPSPEIEYALGRPFGFTDEDLANEILAAAKNKRYAIREFVQTLVLSKPFQTK